MEASTTSHTENPVTGGALFKRDKGPAYTGVIRIGEDEHRIVCWANTSANGTKYLSIRADKPREDAEPITTDEQGAANADQAPEDAPQF